MTQQEPILLPQPIKDFTEAAIVCDWGTLPYNYPSLEDFPFFQDGYRYLGTTREDLTSDKEGDWQPGWYVIASSYFDDPFFVDIGEEESGFPVYYAPHGAGSWIPLTVAPGITPFKELLSELEGLRGDKDAALHFLEAHTDLDNKFWQEVCQSIIEQDEFEKEQEEADVNPEDLCGEP